MEKMTGYSLDAFAGALASKAPVPGGGGASALVGSLGASLGGMVAALTDGKKKYAAVQSDIERLLVETEQLRLALLAQIDGDAAAFEPLSRAYGLPRNTPEEMTYRCAVLEQAQKDACEPPFEILRLTLQTLNCVDELARKGSILALSDAGAAAALCRAALQGAVMNIYINASGLQDRALAAELKKQADALVEEGVEKADEIYAFVKGRIGG